MRLAVMRNVFLGINHVIIIRQTQREASVPKFLGYLSINAADEFLDFSKSAILGCEWSLDSGGFVEFMQLQCEPTN